MLRTFLKLFLEFILLILFIIGCLFVFFNLPVKDPKTKVDLGVTFSHRYAMDLGLDWKETYQAILSDLEVKKIRIPVYWDLVEKEKDVYDFSDVDWQLEEARSHGAEVILVVGQRVPRWPECFVPEWIEDDEMRKKQLLEIIRETVVRYKNHEEIKIWQVENEPFLPFFGICPKFEVVLLEEEIALVKELDSRRPILLTDSGELSLWYQAAKRADIFGTTMYRTIYKYEIGYFTYPVGPNFFRTKRWLIKKFADQENAIVVELQAEPWGSDWITKVPLGEQFKSMNEDKLVENITYARKSGFTEVYLWGAEWWYWLKEKKGYPQVWNQARDLFR